MAGDMESGSMSAPKAKMLIPGILNFLFGFSMLAFSSFIIRLCFDYENMTNYRLLYLLWFSPVFISVIFSVFSGFKVLRQERFVKWSVVSIVFSILVIIYILVILGIMAAQSLW